MTACFNPISMTLESAKLWRELEKANQPTKQQRSVVVKDFKGAMDKRIKKTGDVGGITVFHALL